MEYANKKIPMKHLVFSFNLQTETRWRQKNPLQAFETQFERDGPPKHETIGKFKG